MDTQKLLECEKCGSEGIFILVETISSKRVNIDGSYFVKTVERLECEVCNHNFNEDMYRRWRNTRHTNKLRRWIKENEIPF